MTNRYLDGERPAPTPEPSPERSRADLGPRDALAPTSLPPVPGASRGVPAPRRARPSSGSSSVRRTSSSTPRSRGSWRRPGRPVTRRPGERLRGVLGDLIEACRLLGLAVAPFMPGTRRGSWPSSATTIRTAPTATAARRSSRSWRGAPTRTNPVGWRQRSRCSHGSRPKPRPTDAGCAHTPSPVALARELAMFLPIRHHPWHLGTGGPSAPNDCRAARL